MFELRPAGRAMHLMLMPSHKAVLATSAIKSPTRHVRVPAPHRIAERQTSGLIKAPVGFFAARRNRTRVPSFYLEFRSRDTISLNVNLSAPPVTPTPTPVSIFNAFPL